MVKTCRVELKQVRTQQSGVELSQIRQHPEDAKTLDLETDGLRYIN